MGLLSGTLTFEDVPQFSDADGALTWTKLKQTGASLYRGGFTGQIPAIASLYVPPAARQQVLLFTNPTLGPGSVSFVSGDLVSPITIRSRSARPMPSTRPLRPSAWREIS